LGACPTLRAGHRAIRSNLFAAQKVFPLLSLAHGRLAALANPSGIHAAASMAFLLLVFCVRKTPHVDTSRHPWRHHNLAGLETIHYNNTSKKRTFTHEQAL
jgi:hypothetical protein